MSHEGEGEENRLVLLMLGRDDVLLVACLNSSAAPSDNDVPIWRTRETLRVRYFSRVMKEWPIVDSRQAAWKVPP